MPENLRSGKVDMLFPPALFIVDAEVSIHTISVTLTQDILFKKGALVSAAAVNGVFAKFLVSAIPLSTDVVGVIMEEKLTAAGDVLHYIAVKGSFSRTAVLAADALAPDATQLAALREVYLKQGIYLVAVKG